MRNLPNSDENTALSTTGKTKVLDLDYKIAGLLCYVPIFALNVISSAVLLKTEPKQNRFLRFHAMQSLVVAGAMLAFSIISFLASSILGAIPLVSLLLIPMMFITGFVTLGYVGVCIFSMIAAYKGSYFKLPFAGAIAEQLVDSGKV